MPNKKESIVYWSPVFFDPNTDWNMMYYDLTSLYESYRSDRSIDEKENNFFFCPAFQNVAQKTFVIKNPIHSSFEIKNGEVEVKSKNFIHPEMAHQPCISNNTLLTYGLRYIFFSETDINMTITSPYFTQSKHLQYGSLVPGKLNIGSWFRVLNLEFNLWSNKFEIDKDEAIAYVSFDTDSNVKLKRFEMSPLLHKYAASCGSSSKWESFVPLSERYKRFKQTRTNKLVLKEIKENLVV